MLGFTKKRSALVAAAITAVVMSVAAYAYFTSSGTGGGTATTSNGSSVSVDQTTSPTLLAPGTPEQLVNFNINNSNTGNDAGLNADLASTYVKNVVVTIGAPTKAGAAATGCAADDYKLNSKDSSVVISGGGTIATVDVSSDLAYSVDPANHKYNGLVAIEFNNKPTVNQDGCKGATVPLSYQASGS